MSHSDDEKAEISEINARCPQNGRKEDGAHSLSPIYRRPKDSAPNIDAPVAIDQQHSDNTLEGIADEYNQFGTICHFVSFACNVHLIGVICEIGRCFMYQTPTGINYPRDWTV